MSKEKNISAAPIDDCPIKKHTAKTWLAALILGVFIGLAVIVPGVSGSTIAIIFGLYTGMLYGLGNIFNDFKRCFAFLLPIGIGAVVGFGAGFLVIQNVFEKYVFQVICLFVGLMIGAVPALTREIKGEKKTPLRGILFAVGVAIPLAIGAVSIALSGGAETTATFTDFPISRIIAYLPLGFIVSVTQIVPGLSATAILMAFGQFKPILNSLHRDYIFENPQVILLYGAIGLGFVAGIVCVSRIFSAILKKHKTTAFFMVIGLSFGSTASMFLNTDVYTVYVDWAANGVSVPTVIISAVLLAVGFVGSFLLTKYELSHNNS
jgi:putative membrane protein